MSEINSLEDCYEYIGDGHALRRLGLVEDICIFLNKFLELKGAKRISIEQIPYYHTKGMTHLPESKYDLHSFDNDFTGCAVVKSEYIGWWLCDQLGVSYEQKMGRGFQARECLEQIQKFIKEHEESKVGN